MHADADRLEESLLAIRAARFARTLAEMRRNAGERGVDQISDAEIEAEIAAVRKERALDVSGRH